MTTPTTPPITTCRVPAHTQAYADNNGVAPSTPAPASPALVDLRSVQGLLTCARQDALHAAFNLSGPQASNALRLAGQILAAQCECERLGRAELAGGSDE
jgi:hypothetical protein